MDTSDALLTSFDDLRAPFEAGAKGDGPRGVGTEHEKLGFDERTLQPLRYEGESGIGALLHGLQRFGWNPLYDGGQVLALERDGAAITLEPGGQFELSGKVTSTIDETRDELLTHLSEVREVGRSLGQLWTHHAIQPFVDLDDVPWMPKSRYGIMRDYLPTRASRPWWMMKMTCTVQANYDYRDEADAMDMLRLAASLNPLVTALFAASPIRLGVDSGWASSRMWAWEDTDPQRCGVPPALFANTPSFDDYIEWLLDVPMFFVRRNASYINLAGQSFRDLLQGRLEGLQATLGDWELHQSTAFPDVRLKKYIETRTSDAGPPDLLLALPALWKAVFYDDTARQRAHALADISSAAEATEMAHVAAVHGLQGSFHGRSLRTLAEELVELAQNSLERQAVRDGHRSEARWLQALRQPNGELRDRAAEVRQAFVDAQGDPRSFLTTATIDDAVAWLEQTRTTPDAPSTISAVSRV